MLPARVGLNLVHIYTFDFLRLHLRHSVYNDITIRIDDTRLSFKLLFAQVYLLTGRGQVAWMSMFGFLYVVIRRQLFEQSFSFSQRLPAKN